MSRKRISSCLDDPSQAAVLPVDNRVLVYTSPLSLQEIAIFGIIRDLWSRQDLTSLAVKPVCHSYHYLDSDTSDDCFGSDEDVHHSCEAYLRYNARMQFRSYNRCECDDDSKALVKIYNNLSNNIKELGLPKTVCSFLRRRLPKTKNAISSWASYLRDQVFLRTKKYVVYKHLNHLVWKRDGTIDHFETAKNIIRNCDEMSGLKKFRLMSVYCMEEEIRGNPPSHRVLETCSLIRKPLILCYWSNYVSGTLDKMKGTFTCAESRVIMSNGVSNSHAMEYFWNKLPVTERMPVAKYLIRGRRYQSFVLNRLSEIEQYQLFATIPHTVIENFIKDDDDDDDDSDSHDDLNISTDEDDEGYTEDDYPSSENHPNSDYIFSTWKYTKNFLSSDHFVEILKVLVPITSLSYVYSDHKYSVDDLICRIWDDCPNHLKQYALNSPTLQLINNLTLRLVKLNVSRTSVNVLSKVLSDASSAVKNEFLYSAKNRDFWKHVVLNNQWSFFHNLFKICGGKEKDANEFKKGTLDSRCIKEHSLKCFKDGQKEKLDEFLRMCFSDNQAIVDYKIRLLTSNEVARDLATDFGYANWVNHWIEVIDDISPDPKTAYEYKKKLAFSTVALDELGFSIERQQLAGVQKFCSSLLNYKDGEKMKNILLQRYLGKRYSEIFVNFNDRFWNEFLLWALGCENIQQCKLSLPIDDIFEKLLIATTFRVYDRSLTECKFHYRQGCDFANIDKFLLWFCDTKEKVKLFKRQKIYKYEQIEMITNLLKKSDTNYLIEILYWFLDGDVEEIEIFQKKFSTKKISSIALGALRFISNN